MLKPISLLLFLLACDKSLRDADADGFAAGKDCDDQDATVWPGAPERCDGLDNDCDTDLDEGVSYTWYIDVDKDGYGVEPTVTCGRTEGLAEVDGDCDDLNAEVYPSAEELCDGLDNDCDPSTLESPPAWYPDGDGDGYGAGDPTLACEAPEGSSALSTDCDDNDAAVNPGADEHCDGEDEDCDGEADEDPVDGQRWYPDRDYDNYGDEASSFRSCDTELADHILTGGDCDDSSASVHPDADEYCDGVDQDCDGTPDNDALDAALWSPDKDADGYGDASATGRSACSGAAGEVPNSLDCDDSDPTLNPDAEEICEDGLDNNCDGGGCSPWGDLDLSAQADWTFTGDKAGDSAAEAMRTSRGDHDGDGQDDLLLSASRSGKGLVVVFSGPLGADGALSDADVVISPSGGAELLGHRLSWVPDLDGDGDDELLLGAPGDDSVKSDGGAVYLLSGPLTTGDLSGASAQVYGLNKGDALGMAVAAPGDTDGDGAGDLLLGASGVGSSNNGAAYLLRGPFSGSYDAGDAALTLTGAGANDQAGAWVARAGDTQGDGGLDLLISAPGADGAASGAGAVILVPGESSGSYSLGSIGVRVMGLALNDGAGAQAEAGQDANGDGYGDLLLGVPGDDSGGTNAGAVYLFLGPFSSDLDLSHAATALIGDGYNDGAGRAVSWAGDLDQDGQEDMVLGATTADGLSSQSGAAYVWYGPLPAGTWSASEGDALLLGASTADYAGSTVGGVGDLDGDGYGELLIGAYGADSSAGVFYVLRGGGK